jgi:hypothetical protein
MSPLILFDEHGKCGVLTRKERMINAHKGLVDKYNNNTWTGYPWDCPLCFEVMGESLGQTFQADDTNPFDPEKCIECTQGNILWYRLDLPIPDRGHCKLMRTYPLGSEKCIRIRIEYHQKAITILEQLPDYRFELGYLKLKLTPFPELWELDNRLAEERFRMKRIKHGVYVRVSR